MTVRTRFAPSPTGFMHVGGVRTALFAWLYARQQNGQFILRIEDTDKKRETAGSIEHIMESLRWLGLEWDEGPDTGGNFGPYKQSDRLDTYRDYAQRLIDKDLAYADPFSQDEVERLRQQSKTDKRPFLFREHRPQSFATPPDWYGRAPIRFKSAQIRRYEWHDAVRGDLSAGPEALDDFIIVKADGFPTYNFAHVVDDHLMQITHVIRGEEFIASTANYLALHEALGIKAPVFATAPPILGASGGKKLSKREGAKDVLAYRDAGYLPQAVVNFLASLGWNDGTEQEVYAVEDLIRKFSLKRIQKSGARFDETKLDWLNWQHFVRLSPHDQLRQVYSGAELENQDQEYLKTVAQLAVTKAHTIEEFKNQTTIFISEPKLELTPQLLGQIDPELTADKAKTYLEAASGALQTIKEFSAQNIEAALRRVMAEQGASPREFLNLVRWAASGQKVSPGLFEMIELLGKDKVIDRLQY